MAKEKGIAYGIVFSYGLSILVMLLMYTFLYPNVLYKDFRVDDFFFVSSIGFGVGAVVGGVLAYFGLKSDFNVAGFTVWILSLMLLMWSGEVFIGEIYLGSLLIFIVFTSIATLIYSLIVIGVTQLLGLDQ